MIVKGKFLTDFPNLVEEFDFVKNHPLLPENIKAGSSKKIWWIGKNCKHEFEQLIKLRTRLNYSCNNKNCISNKRKNTNKKRYGCVNPAQNEIVKFKMKETNKERYGCENPAQNEIIKFKMKETNIVRYGCENPAQNEDVKLKMKETMLDRHGVEFALQNEYFKNKVKVTNIKNFGVEYPTQNPIISEKQLKNTKKFKTYNYPSGNKIHIQGYENLALDILLETYNEEYILTNRTDMPKISYQNDNKNHVYFPDIYIPKENLIIEVKSEYTYNINLDINILKKDAVKALDYKYEFWIFDPSKNLRIIKH